MLRGVAVLLGAAGVVALVVPVDAEMPNGDAFVEGSGVARATGLRLSPHTGGLNYSITMGDSLASYQGTEGRAQAQAVDLGIFGIAATTVAPCGQEPPFRHDQLPGPVQANSSHGPGSASHRYGGDSPAGGGTDSAQAERGSSSADSAGGTVAMAAALRADGVISHAETRLVPGRRREARAEVSISSLGLAGGAVQLLGLHWDVTQHTGDVPVASGSFRVNRVFVHGVPLDPVVEGTSGPVEQGMASLDQVNHVLEPMGMHLAPPAVRNAPEGAVEVTPLRLTMGGPTRMSQPMGGVVGSLQPQRDAVAGAFRGEPDSCRDPRTSFAPAVGATLLVADVVVGGMAGTGGLIVDIGGVHASTEGTWYRNPFDVNAVEPPLPAVAALPPITVVERGPGTDRTGSVPAPVSAPGAAAASAPPSTTVITPAAAAPSYALCASTFADQGCGRDVARIAAGSGLGAAILLVVGDRLVTWRRRRTGVGR